MCFFDLFTKILFIQDTLKTKCVGDWFTFKDFLKENRESSYVRYEGKVTPPKFYQRRHSQKGQKADCGDYQHTKAHLASRPLQCHKKLVLFTFSFTLNFQFRKFPSLSFSLFSQLCYFNWALSFVFHFYPLSLSLLLCSLCLLFQLPTPLPSQVCLPCSVHYFLSLIWTLPDISSCSFPPIYNKNLHINHAMMQSCPPFTRLQEKFFI